MLHTLCLEINQPVTVYKWGSPPDYYDDHFTYDLGESNLPAGLQFNPDPPLFVRYADSKTQPKIPCSIPYQDIGRTMALTQPIG